MKSVHLTGIRQMAIEEVPDPVRPGPNEVLLRIRSVGICGSDVHYYETGRIGDQIVQYPYSVGHECAGEVVTVGSAVTGLQTGDRVVIDPAMPCLECDQCKAGRENTCRELLFLGCPGQAEGCLSELMVMPAHCCFKMPESMTYAQGVLCEPLAIGLYAVQQAKIKPDMDVAILGSGPIGLSCLVCAQAEGASGRYVTDKRDYRLKLAQDHGATWVGNPDRDDIVSAINQAQPAGMDVVFECAGEQDTVNQAMSLLKPGGTLMLIGIPRVDEIAFPIHTMRRNEITVVNVRRQNHCTQTTIDWVASGKIDADFMVTHTLGLADVQRGFDLVADYQDGVIKAIVEMD